MKKILFVIFLSNFLFDFAFGQAYSLSSNDPYSVTNGEKNLMLIRNEYDTLKMQVRVSNGTIIKEDQSKKLEAYNKVPNQIDTNYVWQLCSEKHELQKLYLDYYYNNELIITDTFYFGLMSPSDFTPYVLFHTDKNVPDILMDDNSKLPKLQDKRFLMELTLFNSKNLKYFINNFKIDVFSNNTLLKTFYCPNSLFISEIRNYLIEHPETEVYIYDINAELNCGMEIFVRDSPRMKLSN